MSRKCIVFIYLEGEVIAVPAGELVFSEEIVTFTYGANYLKRPNRLPVDPLLLPLEAVPRQISLDAGCLGTIRDSAPDFWGRRVLEIASHKEKLEEIDYLLTENSCRVGNLDFRSKANSPEPQSRPPAFSSLEDLLSIAENIEKNNIVTDIQKDLLMLLQNGSSIGGARPKSTILDSEGLWVAKFPSREDKWSNARVEAATMHLASECGINIPKIKIIVIHGKDVFFIKRFDRTLKGNSWTRSGYMSALSLLKITESERDKFSYLQIADKMRQHDMANNTKELFCRMIFNILCRNTDDHPKNHGFIFSDNKFQLSPAFDITPLPSTSGISTDYNLAMTVGELGKNATINNALSACQRFGLNRDDAMNMIKSMSEIVTNRWSACFDIYNVSEEDKNRFAFTFERWKELNDDKNQEESQSFAP